jgi:hypothetical protein
MTDTTPQYKPGDVSNGHVLTESGQWVPIGGAPAPITPTKKTHTVRNVFLGIMLAGILLVGGCFALVGAGLNAADKSITEDANKAGGTDNPLTIHAGQSFEVDGFHYDNGWSVHKDGLGDLTVSGLKVTNNRASKDSALVEIKFWKGKEVIGLADCTTEPIAVGTTVTLSCLSTDRAPKGYDRISINDAF